MDNLHISVSPHIKSKDSTKKIMWLVVAALIPAGIFGFIMFGWYSLVITLTSIATAVLCEGIYQKLTKKPVTIGDGSAVLTGLILAYSLPPTVPLIVPIIGSGFGIVIVKQLFGGLGYNIWNPAMGGRAFVHIAFADWMNNSFIKFNSLANPNKTAETVFNFFRYSGRTASDAIASDAITTATPLSEGALKVFHHVGDAQAMLATPHYDYANMFFGKIPGCIGEVSAALLLAGGIFLIAMKLINWRVPVFYIGTVALFAFIFPHKDGYFSWFGGDVLYQILAGGLFLGAFFIATDYVTTPLTHKGLIIFAIGCGVLTGIIRFFGGYPEGVCFSILLMNTATPLIDRITRPRVMGVKK